MTAVIYSIESPSEAIYIGQSRNVKKRHTQYRGLHCVDQPKLYNSLKKYGFETHTVRILHHFTANVPQSVLDGYEIQYIELFKKSGFRLMNIRGGGQSGVISEETKRKMSNAMKGKNRLFGSENPFYGKRHSKETRRKISESHRGIRLSEDHKRKLHNARRGKPAWNSGLKYTDEQKAKVPSFAGRKHTEQTKSLMSLASKKIRVIQFSKGGELIKEWSSATEAARSLNKQMGDISKCCRGIIPSAGGFIWKYKTILT